MNRLLFLLNDTGRKQSWRIILCGDRLPSCSSPTLGRYRQHDNYSTFESLTSSHCHHKTKIFNSLITPSWWRSYQSLYTLSILTLVLYLLGFTTCYLHLVFSFLFRVLQHRHCSFQIHSRFSLPIKVHVIIFARIAKKSCISIYCRIIYYYKLQFTCNNPHPTHLPSILPVTLSDLDFLSSQHKSPHIIKAFLTFAIPSLITKHPYSPSIKFTAPMCMSKRPHLNIPTCLPTIFTLFQQLCCECWIRRMTI